ncbi:circadian-associated transcriptional repressor-like [Conger conger]|uniref:circadian-associated transcriptional repressor-like n=1 Tax=Conger conger TaxID=82655 RepID=UPI002A59B650|nr:circadian-associated transcriptional repressor-like [Conger conger]
MQSSGSTSSQPSHDSLSSSDSFLFSDGDHTEDEGSVFLSESESRGRPRGASYCLDRGSSSSPSSQWALDGFGDQERSSLLTSGRVERCPSNASYSALVTSSNGAKDQEGGRRSQTEGDYLFAQKCVELQGFVRPLLDLLNGLKKGRFDRGLSSFQQSVAMDRIQRIVGVLQKPTIGGKHLHTLLQVEMMLKLWFPQISPCAPSGSGHSAPPHKHRDQLHIPVKKRRLSWSDIDSPPPPPRRGGRSDRGGQEEGGAGGEEGSGPARPAFSGGAELGRPAGEGPGHAGGEREKPEHKVTRWSELSTAWVHASPVVGPPKSCPSQKSGGSSSSPATQDSSVSSTTPSSDPRRLRLPQCQPVACQSQPVATETEDCEAGQGRSQSLPPALKPSSGVERVRMHSATQT